MSYTEIYVVSESSCKKLGETKNAFRGAMYVWDDIAKRYFGLESFPYSDEAMQRRVWNAQNEKPLSEAETIVLSSTMDRASVKIKDAGRLITALKEYGETHPNSSLGEQAQLIEDAISNGKFNDLPEGALIAWCQTTVGEFIFASELIEYDEDGEHIEYERLDDEQYKYADLSPAWDLFEQYDAIVHSKTGN